MITIIMETYHVYDLYGPCSCRGWASACLGVATEATLQHLTGSPTGSGSGACCSGPRVLFHRLGFLSFESWLGTVPVLEALPDEVGLFGDGSAAGSLVLMVVMGCICVLIS